MKKIVTIFIFLVLTLFVFACGGGGKPTEKTSLTEQEFLNYMRNPDFNYSIRQTSNGEETAIYKIIHDSSNLERPLIIEGIDKRYDETIYMVYNHETIDYIMKQDGEWICRTLISGPYDSIFFLSYTDEEIKEAYQTLVFENNCFTCYFGKQKCQFRIISDMIVMPLYDSDDVKYTYFDFNKTKINVPAYTIQPEADEPADTQPIKNASAWNEFVTQEYDAYRMQVTKRDTATGAYTYETICVQKSLCGQQIMILNDDGYTYYESFDNQYYLIEEQEGAYVGTATTKYVNDFFTRLKKLKNHYKDATYSNLYYYDVSIINNTATYGEVVGDTQNYRLYIENNQIKRMTIKGDYIDLNYVIEYDFSRFEMPEYTVDLSSSKSHQMIMEILDPAMSSGTIQYAFYDSSCEATAEGTYNYQIEDGKILLNTSDTYLMINETGQFLVYSRGNWEPLLYTTEAGDSMSYVPLVYEAIKALIGYRGQYVRGGHVVIRNKAYLFTIAAYEDTQIRYLLSYSNTSTIDINIINYHGEVEINLPTE